METYRTQREINQRKRNLESELSSLIFQLDRAKEEYAFSDASMESYYLEEIGKFEAKKQPIESKLNILNTMRGTE